MDGMGNFPGNGQGWWPQAQPQAQPQQPLVQDNLGHFFSGHEGPGSPQPAYGGTPICWNALGTQSAQPVHGYPSAGAGMSGYQSTTSAVTWARQPIYSSAGATMGPGYMDLGSGMGPSAHTQLAPGNSLGWGNLNPTMGMLPPGQTMAPTKVPQGLTPVAFSRRPSNLGASGDRYADIARRYQCGGPMGFPVSRKDEKGRTVRFSAGETIGGARTRLSRPTTSRSPDPRRKRPYGPTGARVAWAGDGKRGLESPGKKLEREKERKRQAMSQEEKEEFARICEATRKVQAEVASLYAEHPVSDSEVGEDGEQGGEGKGQAQGVAQAMPLKQVVEQAVGELLEQQPGQEKEPAASDPSAAELSMEEYNWHLAQVFQKANADIEAVWARQDLEGQE